jgi:hypothetical protein
MLAKTSEYANFANHALASGDSGVRYMGSENVQSTNLPKNGATQAADERAEDEQENWIPEEAYKVAHDFRNKCAANVSKALMNTML